MIYSNIRRYINENFPEKIMWQYVGSIIRGKKPGHDIDVLVVVPGTELYKIKRIHIDNVPVDIILTSPDIYQTVKMWWGSGKKYITALASIAKAKGYKLSPYGLFKDGILITRDEHEIHHILGRKYIPYPERDLPVKESKETELVNKLRNWKLIMGPKQTTWEKLPDGIYIIQEKIDGIMVIYDIQTGEIYSKSGLSWKFPEKYNINAIFIAELTALDNNNQIVPFNNIRKAAKNPENIVLYIFDIYEIEGKTLETPYSERFKTIKEIIDSLNNDHLRIVETTEGNIEKAKAFFNKVIEKGGEGVVLTNIETDKKYKIKRTLTYDLAAVAYSEEKRTVLCGLFVPPSKFVILGKARLPKKLVDDFNKLVDKTYGPRNELAWIHPIVVEVVARRSTEREYPVVYFDGSGYLETEEQLKAFSIEQADVIRIRDDKDFTETNLG